MPIYEYCCAACGHELEALQKINDARLSKCPQCQALELKKKISASAFRLSGSGWYETDFKSKNQRNISGDSQPSSTGASAETGPSVTKAPDASAPPAAAPAKSETP